MATVGSLLINLDRLVGHPALLGVRCTFAFPSVDRRSELTEMSLPAHPEGFLSLLERRAGLRIRARSRDGLHEVLDAGSTAVAAVDSFHLPYRPAFGRVHSHRTIVVRALDRDHVEVDDLWPPAFRGPVRIADFERSRFSDVPLDPAREPIFAGRPIRGEWFHVEHVPDAPEDGFEWAASSLAELSAEAVHDVVRDGVAYGPAAMSGFIDALAQGAIGAREASLLLRAELGARVYLCPFLGEAARRVGDRTLAHDAAHYADGLRAMELARDVLAKSLAHPMPRLTRFVLDRLREARDGECRLIERLARWSLSTPDTRIA